VTSGKCSSIIIADIDQDGMDRLSESLRGGDCEVSIQVVDVCDEASVVNLVEGSPESKAVVITTGIFAASPSTEVTRQEFRQIMEVNCEGVFFVAQAFARQMCTTGGGSIVALSSIAARMPRMRQAAYSASKAGLRQALRVLGMEVAGLGVRINTVAPGPTDTPMMRQLARDHSSIDDLAQGSLDTFRPRIPIGKVAVPEDIAETVEYLLFHGHHITMCDIVVDGGELLGM
jgi:2,3-dihydro-2,3-dihydroxybenzoate dehydrogenase